MLIWGLFSSLPLAMEELQVLHLCWRQTPYLQSQGLLEKVWQSPGQGSLLTPGVGASASSYNTGV